MSNTSTTVTVNSQNIRSLSPSQMVDLFENAPKAQIQQMFKEYPITALIMSLGIKTYGETQQKIEAKTEELRLLNEDINYINAQIPNARQALTDGDETIELSNEARNIIRYTTPVDGEGGNIELDGQINTDTAIEMYQNAAKAMGEEAKEVTARLQKDQSLSAEVEKQLSSAINKVLGDALSAARNI